MSEIQDALHELASARLTPTVLNALDFVVPGEWYDAHSLEDVIEHSLEVDDPVEAARIKERAEALWEERPHYRRALTVFRAADSFDKATAAAVMAAKAGSAFSFLGILDRFTPKPDTSQAIDAALKLTAEVLGFALLRGIPVTSLTEAKAFPATLATYARADMMRLAAWITIDGMLPLGPDFVAKIRETVRTVDLSVITNNKLFQQLKEMLPGGSDEDHKNFVLAALDSGQAFLTEFVKARGIEPADVMDSLGGVVNIAESGAELLAATLDATTNYYAHTGLQSVARVLVMDAAAELEGEPAVVGEVVGDPEETKGLSPWFAAAGAAAVGAGGLAVGSLLLRRRGDGAGIEEGGGAFWDDGEAVDADGDGIPDISDDALMARELAAEMLDRELEDYDDPNLPGGDADAGGDPRRRQRMRQRRQQRMGRARQMRQQRGGRGRRAQTRRQGRRRGPNRRRQRKGQLQQDNERMGGQVRQQRQRRRGGGGGGGRGGRGGRRGRR